MIANVVPILRLRRATTWWSYTIPRSLQCTAGSLVKIPFRGKECLGIVWSIEEESHTEKPLASLSAIITQQPLIRAPHRAFIEWLAEYGICSLSTALYTVVPAVLRKGKMSKSTTLQLEQWDTPLETAAIAAQKQHAILTPSQRPHAANQLTQKYGTEFAILEHSNNDTHDFQQWLGVANGTIRLATGREYALFAPWINLRHLTIIEPEDISYYHEQVPYIPLIQAALRLAHIHHTQYTVRSALPTRAAQVLWGDNTLGTSEQSTARIIDINREEILGTTLLEAIKQAIAAQKQVIILYNAHDRSVENKNQEQVIVPGIETLRKRLAYLLGYEKLPALITFDTRTLFKDSITSAGVAIILSIDPLLAQETFANQLHGWGDVGRLLNLAKTVIIQTHHASHPMIHALRNGQFEAWCVEQINEAKVQELPPFAEHIVCSIKTTLKGVEKIPLISKKLHNIVSMPWQLSEPFQIKRRGQETFNILLYAPTGSRLPEPLVRYLATLPYPWKVQRNPWYTL